MAELNEGDWVRWTWAGDPAYGKVTEVVTEAGTTRSAGGNEFTATEDRPLYVIKSWDDDSESWGGRVVKLEGQNDLQTWDGAPSDAPMMSDDGRTTQSDSSTLTMMSDGVASQMSQATFEERVDASDDVFQTREAAQERAAEIGCEGVHPHEHDMGTVYMPCASMDAYEEMTDSGVVSDPLMNFLSDAAMSVEDITVDIPESAQSAAQAYVDANDADLIPSSCGTGKGTRIAGAIADNDVSIQQIRQDIAPYLTSHEDDTSTDTHPSDWSMDESADDSHWMDCGDAQYAAWGWHSLRDYAQRKANEHARVVGEDEPYADSHVSDASLPLADATTVMDTITYDGVMTGELDESEIPTDEYQPHYVFDGDTKSESAYPLVDGDGNLRRRNVELAFNMRGQTAEGDDEAFLLDVLAEVNDAFDSPPIDEDDLMDAMAETDGGHMEEEDGYHMEEEDSHHMEDAVAATNGFRDHVPPAFTVDDTTLADGAVNWDSVPTETLTDAPHRHAFGTDEFYAIDATVAKPMDQEYHIGEETVTFRKTADELRAAAWQLDNVPWTLGHPDANEVTDADQIHGFFRDPQYVDGEGLTAMLYVPVDDTKAREMLTDTAAVSIGFTPEIDYDVSDPAIDGVQRDLVIDHVASVQQGRCSVEDGCGIKRLTDADDGTVAVSDCVSCSTGACSCGWHTEYHDDGGVSDTTDEDDTDMSNEFGLDFTDLSADVIVDNHDGVAEMMQNKDEQIAELQAERDTLTDRNEALADALDDRLYADYETARDTLVDHTGRYEADELDERWQAADSVQDKRAIVTDLSEKVALLNDVADSATDESVSTLADSEAQHTNETTETRDGLRDLREQTA